MIALAASGCGSVLRDMFDVTDRATRRQECRSSESGERDDARRERDAHDEPTTLRLDGEALGAGRITASVRRRDAANARELEDACSQGAIRVPELAWIEVSEDTSRFDVSVRVDGQSPRIVALRSEGGATTCVRVGNDHLARWRRTVSEGRYQLLTDLDEEGTYDVVISSPR